MLIRELVVRVDGHAKVWFACVPGTRTGTAKPARYNAGALLSNCFSLHPSEWLRGAGRCGGALRWAA